MSKENIDQKFMNSAESALHLWGIPQSAKLHQITRSENAVYLVTDSKQKYVMRVHRVNYHSIDAVRSELSWSQALNDDAGIATPTAIPGLNGELIQIAPTLINGERPMVVLFEFINGEAPKEDELLSAYKHLGSITAAMHKHSAKWTRPSYFDRPVWDYEGAFGQKPNWGHWINGYHESCGGLEVVKRAEQKMKMELSKYGKSPNKFGLIHSDFRTANLLVHNGETKVLDFDDCGIGWFMYDFASSVTFLENEKNIDDLLFIWLSGYSQRRVIERDDLFIIPSLMMFRRLVLMGWAGSHADTDLAKEMGTQFTVGTAELAEKFLSDRVINLKAIANLEK